MNERAEPRPTLVADTTLASTGMVTAHIGNVEGNRSEIVEGVAVNVIDDGGGPLSGVIVEVHPDGRIDIRLDDE